MFSIEIDATSARVSIEAAGELDLAGGRRLRDAIEPFITGTAPRVALDLGAISFADSSGAIALVDLADRIRRNGGTLDITRSSRAIERIFHILGEQAMSRPPD